MNSLRQLQLSALLASVALPAWGGSALAQGPAASVQVPFSIPRGELGPALQAFATQSGVEVIFSPRATRGRSTPGVSGRMNSSDALRRLLVGTGFSFVRDSSGAVLVRPAAARPATASAPAPRQVAVAPVGGPMETAAPAEVAAEADLGQDIVVTAQRREQRAADVPISMNVFDRDTIESRRLNSIEDLAQLTPASTSSKATAPTTRP